MEQSPKQSPAEAKAGKDLVEKLWGVQLVPSAEAVEPVADLIERLTFDEKTAINKRFQELYDAGMQSGEHGHYETMFRAMHQAYAAVAPSIPADLQEQIQELREGVRPEGGMQGDVELFDIDDANQKMDEAAASLSQISTKLENAERERDEIALRAAVIDESLTFALQLKRAAEQESDELRAKLAGARAEAFEEAAQIAENLPFVAEHHPSRIAKAIRARAVQGAGQS